MYLKTSPIALDIRSYILLPNATFLTNQSHFFFCFLVRMSSFLLARLTYWYWRCSIPFLLLSLSWHQPSPKPNESSISRQRAFQLQFFEGQSVSLFNSLCLSCQCYLPSNPGELCSKAVHSSYEHFVWMMVTELPFDNQLSPLAARSYLLRVELLYIIVIYKVISRVPNHVLFALLNKFLCRTVTFLPWDVFVQFMRGISQATLLSLLFSGPRRKTITVSYQRSRP